MTACARCSYDPDAQVTARWEFHIDREVKSGNAHVFNIGSKRFGYGKERAGWRDDFSNMRAVKRIPLATTKRRVTLTRIIGYRQRAFDQDNLRTGLKSCLDGMVWAGLLKNDTAEWAEVHYEQVKRDGVYGLHVLLEELAS